MRIVLISALVLGCLTVAASAQVYHQGYYRRDGTYVQPHFQTAPNGTKLDNWSTQGNYNPYTGQPGTVNPYAMAPAPQPYNPYYAAPPPAYPTNTYQMPMVQDGPLR